MWYIILSLIIAIYIAINLALPGLVSGSTSSYIIQPILWIALGIATFIIAKYEGLNILKFKKIKRWGLGKSPFQAALLIGGFHVALIVIIGLAFGFGRSPNMITTETFFTFLLYITAPLLGMEISRAYLIKKGTSSKRNITLIIAFVALLYMLLQIQFIKVLMLSPGEPVDIIQFIGETIIPLFAISLFASYLAYYGGAIASFSYLGIIAAFKMYSPLLPDVDWVIISFIEMLVPVIGFLLIQSSIQETAIRTKLSKKLSKRRDPTLNWLAFSVVCLVIILFSFGYFGVQPTIIASGSMSPAIETGDIVLLEELPFNEIKEGDIIQYEADGLSTVHRVYEIKHLENGSTIVITKGDANNKPDVDRIMPEQITGKAVFTVPKLGWIPIAFKGILHKMGIPV